MKKLLLISLSIFTVITVCAISFSYETLNIRKFGGLVTRSNPFELSDSESPNMSNFTLDEAGTLTKRNLFKRYNSVSIGSIAFTNIYKFYTSSDSGYLFLSGNSKLYKATGGAITDISNATSSITSGSQWAFESFTDGTNELCFSANNDCVLQSSNGTANFADEGGYPATNCNILKKHKSRLWASGSKLYPYRIYYSSLSDGDDWTTSGGSMDLPAFEKIMSLEVLSNTLFVFTRTSIYAILGDTPDEFAIQKTRSTVGTHAFRSVVVGNKLIYFLNKSGVFVFDGDESVNISETIQPTIDNISSAYLDKSACLFDNRGRLWLAYTSMNGSYNDSILVYDTVIKQWYPLDGANFSAFIKTEGGMDKGEIFATCSNSIGYLWQLQTSSSLESIIHSTEAQLNTGVTFNTVIGTNPTLELQKGNDLSTDLLVHFDGVDGATSYTTEDSGKRTVTFVSAGALDTDQKKFGTASLITNGVGADYVTIPDSAEWQLGGGTGNFTLEAWVRFTSFNNYNTIICQFQDSSNNWVLNYDNLSHNLNFYVYEGASFKVDIDASWSPSINTWYHLAIVRKGYNNASTDWLFTVDGIPLTLSLTVGSWNGNIANFSGPIYIGWQSGTDGVNGNIDEVRISDRARWNTTFIAPTAPYEVPSYGGNLISAPLQINASGQASLGEISWQEYLQSNTDVQFTTRTGVTSDTVYFNGWETWVSSSTVLSYVTDPTVWSTSGILTALSPVTPQTRNVLNYETDDSVSPNTVKFGVSGAVSKNAYATCTIPIKDLSNYKFIGYWLKSDVTGNSVKLDISNTTGNTVGYTTGNTVTSGVWEYHYWNIGDYADKKDIYKIKFTYLGDGSGSIYLGDLYAYDFYDNEDTITSTPNDFIQYKAIMGSTVFDSVPKLILAAGYVIKVSYSSSSGASESELTSYWESKPFDGKSNLNKMWQYISFNLESQNPTTGHTVKCYYETDDGRSTGTLSKTVDVTGRTVNVKFYFPSGTYGRNLKFKFIDETLNSQLKVKNAEIRVVPEGNE